MVSVSEERIFIETYVEAEREELPAFAENRVHQRTSGNPYPNKIVQEAKRSVKEKKEYTCIVLENEFLEIGILPELGGKIWYANDKKNGYGFFYKNNVIKPALIGVLGSWTSGGLEFNWPFHHRASTFMPVDYAIERGEDYVCVWLSEHDPIDRMKGMVGVCLKDGECIFETKVKVDNITPFRRSFLWWENAAVPVDENYRIFFPKDVNYVRFHYKRSVTTYPIANNDRFGAFNGIYYDGDTDISAHKNTKQATSYFSAESKYDYFGGYDEGKKAGVVHIADHHISPGKKMFTWAYSQLAKTWENALTDNDGQYAELMAGCYSDNQPDLTWLMPNETKIFSQKWFPIHDSGIPAFANENGALFVENGELRMQSVRNMQGARVCVYAGETLVCEKVLDVTAYTLTPLYDGFTGEDMRVVVEWKGAVVAACANQAEKPREIPEPRKELPYFKDVKTAWELYLQGLHIEQYRSPEYSAEQCYLEALKRDGEFSPALIALCELSLKKHDAVSALDYAERAERSATRFNARLESGKIEYLKGLALCSLQRLEEGYDALQKAAWCYDYRSAATLYIGLLDMRNKEYGKAIAHFTESLQGNGESVLANAFIAYAYALQGNTAKAEERLEIALQKDKVNLFAFAFRAILDKDIPAFYRALRVDAEQTTLDIAEVFAMAGLYKELVVFLSESARIRTLGASESYVRAWLTGEKANKAKIGIAFPSRSVEKYALEKAIEKDCKDTQALYLYGCLAYGKGLYETGISAWEKALSVQESYEIYRNLATAYYSRRCDRKKALAYMQKSAALAPKDEKQITFETAYVMAKAGASGNEIAWFISSRNADRDDVAVELARAYNHANRPDLALETLLTRTFVACEGGEHAIADQYTYAHYLQGKTAYLQGDYKQALVSFQAAQVLPQSLGSGFWNEIKKVPFQYFEAKCLEKLGKKEEAKEIYRSFQKYRFDFFTDMYLYTFAYYLAQGLRALGESEKADEIVAWKKENHLRALSQETLGYFNTTPFFIGFIDEAERAKRTHHAYPLYLIAKYEGDETAATAHKKTMEQDCYGLYIEDFTL